MNYTTDKFLQGDFCWTDLSSTDIQASKKFFTGLFGWMIDDLPTEPGKPDYTMFYLGEKYVAGAASNPDVLSNWNSYISVTDADDIAAKVEELGGKIIVPSFDLIDAGRIVTIEDPTGAYINFWQPKRHTGAGFLDTPGAMSWNELYTHDIERAKKFYADLLGWEYDTEEEGNYATIRNKDVEVGAIMTIPAETPNLEANWLVSFMVADIENSVAKVEALGGKVYMKEATTAIVAEPTGAYFKLIKE